MRISDWSSACALPISCSQQNSSDGVSWTDADRVNGSCTTLCSDAPTIPDRNRVARGVRTLCRGSPGAPRSTARVGNASVGAELHGGTIESLVLLADDLATVGDPVGTTGGKLAEERAVLDQHLPLVERLAGIHLQLGPGVGDVEVAHGELADPVQGTEGCVVGALHRQLVGVVGEVAARGGQDGVVLTAPQPHGDLTREIGRAHV